jgi:hypothetical protein
MAHLESQSQAMRLRKLGTPDSEVVVGDSVLISCTIRMKRQPLGKTRPKRWASTKAAVGIPGPAIALVNTSRLPSTIRAPAGERM